MTYAIKHPAGSGKEHDSAPSNPSGQSTEPGCTREVPRREWPEFFGTFSRDHQSWRMTLEVLGPDVGAQVEVQDQPLAGITAQLEKRGRDVIAITFGHQEFTRMVEKPKRIWLRTAGDGTDEALEIECASGPATLLRFRGPILLEAVDQALTWGE